MRGPDDFMMVVRGGVEAPRFLLAELASHTETAGKPSDKIRLQKLSFLAVFDR